MTRLRDISLSVEEYEPGHFCWVLMESTGDDVWSELASARDSAPSWEDAFRAGCLALGDLVPRGPSACTTGGSPPDIAAVVRVELKRIRSARPPMVVRRAGTDT